MIFEKVNIAEKPAVCFFFQAVAELNPLHDFAEVKDGEAPSFSDPGDTSGAEGGQQQVSQNQPPLKIPNLLTTHYYR